MIRSRPFKLIGLVAAIALTAAACGRDGREKPASTGLPLGSDTTAATGGGGDGNRAGGSPTQLTLVAENIAFDTETLTAPVGEEVTIEYDNRDDVPHNLHILTEDGEEPATEIETGPVTQTLTFTIDEAGSYTYVCDVHPQQMTGTLQVS
jgi:plastocyanin